VPGSVNEDNWFIHGHNLTEGLVAAQAVSRDVKDRPMSEVVFVSPASKRRKAPGRRWSTFRTGRSFVEHAEVATTRRHYVRAIRPTISDAQPLANVLKAD
jgi:hypothetical protein